MVDLAITGPSLTQGKELEEKKFDADFYSDLHEEGRYLSMKTVEKTTFEGRACYKLSLVKKNGSEDFDFYDVETGLKAGAIGTRESQMGPMSVTQVTSDYKKFGGLLVPTTLKQTAMGVDQVLKFTTVEFDNVPPRCSNRPHNQGAPEVSRSGTLAGGLVAPPAHRLVGRRAGAACQRDVRCCLDDHPRYPLRQNHERPQLGCGS